MVDEEITYSGKGTEPSTALVVTFLAMSCAYSVPKKCYVHMFPGLSCKKNIYPKLLNCHHLFTATSKRTKVYHSNQMSNR
jgi:hypothetical protein